MFRRPSQDNCWGWLLTYANASFRMKCITLVQRKVEDSMSRDAYCWGCIYSVIFVHNHRLIMFWYRVKPARSSNRDSKTACCNSLRGLNQERRHGSCAFNLSYSFNINYHLILWCNISLLKDAYDPDVDSNKDQTQRLASLEKCSVKRRDHVPVTKSNLATDHRPLWVWICLSDRSQAHSFFCKCCPPWMSALGLGYSSHTHQKASPRRLPEHTEDCDFNKIHNDDEDKSFYSMFQQLF